MKKKCGKMYRQASKKAQSPVYLARGKTNKTAANQTYIRNDSLDDQDQQDTSNLLKQVQNSYLSEVNINVNVNHHGDFNDRKHSATHVQATVGPVDNSFKSYGSATHKKNSCLNQIHVNIQSNN